VKSVARWVWERYSADVPPLLREARIVAQREREKDRQRAREAARERSQMTREEYVGPARRRRAEAQEMRAQGVPVREIARVLTISVREVYRLLQDAASCVARLVRSSASPVVQGSPGLSDFKGAPLPLSDNTDAPTSLIDSAVPDPRGVLRLQLSGSRAVVSAVDDDDEHVPTARSAEPNISVDNDRGRGVWGETNAGESSVAYIKRRIREIVANLRDSERPP